MLKQSSISKGNSDSVRVLYDGAEGHKHEMGTWFLEQFCTRQDRLEMIFVGLPVSQGSVGVTDPATIQRPGAFVRRFEEELVDDDQSESAANYS